MPIPLIPVIHDFSVTFLHFSLIPPFQTHFGMMSNGENEEWRRMNDQIWPLSLSMTIVIVWLFARSWEASGPVVLACTSHLTQTEGGRVWRTCFWSFEMSNLFTPIRFITFRNLPVTSIYSLRRVLCLVCWTLKTHVWEIYNALDRDRVDDCARPIVVWRVVVRIVHLACPSCLWITDVQNPLYFPSCIS